MLIKRICLLVITVTLVAAQVATAQTPNADIKVNAAAILQTVSPTMFGINTAVWDSHLDEPYTIDRIRQMGVGILRFPGGSTSDGYHWADGVKGKDGKPSHPNFDDFAQVAKAVGAQAMITVNYGSGTAAEAAAWVRYSNITKHYGFKYWEVGNECYGSWENDKHAVPHDPYTYATEAVKYITAMKAEDPGIKIGVVVETGEDAYANNKDHAAVNPVTGATHYGWTPVVLTTMKSLHVLPDFLIYHRYEQGPHRETDAGLLQAAKTWSGDAANLETLKRDYLGKSGAGIQIVCTENNSVYSHPGKQTTSLVNSLYLADSVGNLLKTPFRTWIWWDLRNGVDTRNNNAADLYGWRQYGDYGVLQLDNDEYPTFYAFEMLTHFARGGDKIVKADSSSSLVGAFACRQKKGHLALLFINKSPNNIVQADVDIAGFAPAASAREFSYGIPQDNAARTGSGERTITRTVFPSASRKFNVSLPPYSLTVLVLRAR